VDVVDQWTGRHASALQFALRMTHDELAHGLGVSRRTVATWHEKPEVVLRTEFQRALDTLYERASDSEKIRFARQLRRDDWDATDESHDAARLSVAIAVVVTNLDVLLVCRRDSEPSGITWQFPAGVVKPGAVAANVAVRETLAETGIHCKVRQSLGDRVHPLSKVHCEYFLCDYLAGNAENADVAENLSVTWVRREQVDNFIPTEAIYPPVLQALKGSK
jgi:8-oxo-dGTP diphosphatase